MSDNANTPNVLITPAILGSLKAAEKATDHDRSSATLECVLLRSDGTDLTIVGTDGRILIECVHPGAAESLGPFDALLPPATVKRLVQALKRALPRGKKGEKGGHVHLRKVGNTLHVEAPTQSLSVPCVDGKFPPYQQVLHPYEGAQSETHTQAGMWGVDADYLGAIGAMLAAINPGEDASRNLRAYHNGPKRAIIFQPAAPGQTEARVTILLMPVSLPE